MPQNNRVPLPELIASLAPVVYPALREEYTCDCCIAAAAILTAVFKQHGYRAETVPVTVNVFNRAMVRLIAARASFPEDKAQREMLFDLTGAWGVGIAPASASSLSALRDVRGGGYGGHLLLKVEGWLIDATIKQAERPEKKMVMPDMIYIPQADVLMRDGAAEFELNDCRIIYRRIHDQSYRTAPDWTRRTTPYPETVRKILVRSETLRNQFTQGKQEQAS